MKMTFVKRAAMVAIMVAITAGIGIGTHLTVEAARIQMMEICCPHCHENTTVNVMEDDVECTCCHSNIHIDG